MQERADCESTAACSVRSICSRFVAKLKHFCQEMLSKIPQAALEDLACDHSRGNTPLWQLCICVTSRPLAVSEDGTIGCGPCMKLPGMSAGQTADPQPVVISSAPKASAPDKGPIDTLGIVNVTAMSPSQRIDHAKQVIAHGQQMAANVSNPPPSPPLVLSNAVVSPSPPSPDVDTAATAKTAVQVRCKTSLGNALTGNSAAVKSVFSCMCHAILQ